MPNCSKVTGALEARHGSEALEAGGLCVKLLAELIHSRKGPRR